MKRDDLYFALSNIDETYIEEAARDIERGQKRIQPYLLRFAALAACFALVITLPMLWMALSPCGGSAPQASGGISGSYGEAATEESKPAEAPESGFGIIEEFTEEDPKESEESSPQDASDSTLPWAGIKAAVWVSVHSSSGQEVIITDGETLERLRDMVLQTAFERGEERRLTDWSYLVDWYDKNDQQLGQLVFLDEKTVVWDEHEYDTIDSDSMDLNILNALFTDERKR